MKIHNPISGSGTTTSQLVWLVATAGGVGHMPFAPGTAGSLVGVGVGVLVHAYPATLTVVTGSIIILALWSGGRAERLLGKKDASPIVIDEVAGMLLCLLGIPITGTTVVLSFVFFRLFDILKIFPASWVQRLPGSWGILLDDVVAAAYTQFVVRGLIWCAVFVSRG